VSQFADGRLLVGGGFSEVDSLPRARLARLSVPDAALQSIEVEDTTVLWQRGGSSPELSASPLLQISSNGINYVDVGAMSMTATGAWRRVNLDLPPPGQTYYLRVRGVVAGGLGNGSKSAIFHTRIFHRAPSTRVFRDGFE
jgi:hypothetical protein